MTNSNVMPSIVQIERESLRQLVTEVRETLATGLNLETPANKPKSFGVVDLWNCHNRRRTATSLRKY